VLPHVSEIIFIEKTFIDSKAEIRQFCFASIDVKIGDYGLINAVILTVNAKSMQVRITPAEGNLYDVMKIGQGRIVADQKAPPDHRTNSANPNMNLTDFGARILIHGAG
jgi:hypothetical protein